MLPILPLERWLAAAALLMAWLALCAVTAWRERGRRQHAAAQATGGTAGDSPGIRTTLVAHASQTGTAEALAWQAVEALRAAGLPTRISSLATLEASGLDSVERVLVVTSTYGEGDPPDTAAPFTRRVMALDDLNLAGLRYGVLALGDRSYKHFCGFGRRLDDWFRGRGAEPLFERIEVDNGDPAAMDRWRRQLLELRRELGGTASPAEALADSAPFKRWRLAERHLLNPGSAGNPVWQLSLVPADAAIDSATSSATHWQAGDLLQVQVPAEPQRPRDYSIATIPAEGRVDLLVRLAQRADGSPGAASGWLGQELAPGGEILARIRPHPSFQLGDNASRPLLLIGNGTGIAGLRALIKARAVTATEADAAPPSWLFYGERQARFDALLDADLQAWQQRGVLTRCDRVYSRDQPQRRYVQHLLAEHRAGWQPWLAEGAAIYVCGSLDGMAAGVEQVLVEALGRDGLDLLISEGRYRRDVY